MKKFSKIQEELIKKLVEALKCKNTRKMRELLHTTWSTDDNNERENLFTFLASDLKTLNRVVKHGFDVNFDLYEPGGSQLIHIASRNKQNDVIERLIECGVNLNLPDRSGKTPLHVAITKENEEILDVLIQNGAAVNNTGFLVSPLSHAVQKCSLKMMKILLDHGADLNAPDVGGYTPLHSAVRLGNIDVVYLLLKSGADVNGTMKSFLLRSRHHLKTPLEMSCLPGHEKCKKLLLSHVIVLKAQGKHVSEANIKCVREEMEKFGSDWEQEVGKLKSETVRRGYKVSLYDVLSRRSEKVCRFLRNQDNQRFLEKVDCRVNFPVFADHFECIRKEYLLEAKVHKEGEKWIDYIINSFYPLDDPCLDKIKEFMQGKDMKNLVRKMTRKRTENEAQDNSSKHKKRRLC